jgi:cell division protein FtsL
VVICAVGLCFFILKLNADVKEGKNEVSRLQSQLNEKLSANAEYSSGLDSMTDLDEIYKIATTELGMVYSKPGQTVYYSQNSDDYVIQYKDIPDAK